MENRKSPGAEARAFLAKKFQRDIIRMYMFHTHIANSEMRIFPPEIFHHLQTLTRLAERKKINAPRSKTVYTIYISPFLYLFIIFF